MLTPSPARSRLYFLDALRGAVVVLVIVLHGAMVYMAYAPEWWYVLDRQRSVLFTWLVLLIDVPNMPAMFFLAGMFALPSLIKRGTPGFLKDKALRIGLPWVFGALFLAPLVTYFIYLSRDVPVGYLQFWSRDFWGPLYQQSVYWFLGVLFVFFGVLAAVAAGFPALTRLRQEVSQPGWKLWLGFTLLMSTCMLLVGTFIPLETWTRAGVFMIQPVRMPLYIGYFLLGMLAWRQGWLTAGGGYQPELVVWGPAAFFFGLAYLLARLLGLPLGGVSAGYALVVAVFNLYCLAAILAGVALFQRLVVRPGGAWGSLAANSYGMYYLHPLILFPIAYLFTGVALPLAVKFPLVVGSTILLSWAASALGLKKLPLVRDIFR